MTTVGILGVTHDIELREKYKLSLDFLKELILDFDPDVIYGEVLLQLGIYISGKSK